MGAEGPIDRPPPPPPPDPPKRYEAAEVVGEGSGAPSDIVERHPADQPSSTPTDKEAASSSDGAVRGDGAGRGAQDSQPTADQQLERWKEADARQYSDQLDRASPEQLSQMRDAEQKEFDHTLEQMQATALKDDPESDQAWREAFDRNQIAQQRLEMVGEKGPSDGGPLDGSAGRNGHEPSDRVDTTTQVDLRSVREIEPAGRAGGPPDSPKEPRDAGPDAYDDVKATATDLINRAEVEKPAITEDLDKAAAATGGALIGHEKNDSLGLEDSRVKSQGSLERKVTDKMNKEGISASEAGDRVNDTLRYTLTYPNDQVADGYQAAKSTLEDNGYKFREVDNRWLDPEPGAYRGINTVVEAPTGQRFELQFHTSESFATKEAGTHDLYETARDTTQPNDTRDSAHLAGSLYSSTLLDNPSGGYDPRPPGIDTVRSFPDNPSVDGGDGTHTPESGIDSEVTKAEQQVSEARGAQFAAESETARVVETAAANAHAEVAAAQGDIDRTTTEIKDIEGRTPASGDADAADAARLDELRNDRSAAYDRLDENLGIESNPESAAGHAERQAAERARADAEQARREAEEVRRRNERA